MDLDELLDDVEQLLGSEGPAKVGGKGAKGSGDTVRSSNKDGASREATRQRTTAAGTSVAVPQEPRASQEPNRLRKLVNGDGNRGSGRSQQDAQASPRSSTRTAPSHRAKPSNPHDDSDVDTLLMDLESSVPARAPAHRVSSRPPAIALSTTSAQGSSSSLNDNGRPTKCAHIVLTDAGQPRGIATSSQACTCSTLRCTSCDHSVCCFDSVRWDDKVDYLFFRNNTPDYDKLKVLLQSQPGGRAYACQCAWASVAQGKRQQVSRGGALKWVCGRHTD